MPADQYSDASGDLHADPFEERLSAALHETGGTFDTDRAALTARGAVRGRRRQLLRRSAVMGGAAGVALVGVGVALIVPGSGETAPRPSSVAADPTAAKTVAPGPVSADDMIRTFEKLLPEGELSDRRWRGANELPASPYAHVVHDDGKGASTIEVSLNRVPPGSDEARETVQCPDKIFIPYDACTTTRLPDGSVVMVMQGYEYPDKRVDTRRWTADLVTPTGGHVSVQEWNAAAEKGAPVTRPTPTLSPQALVKLAAAREWRAVVDGLPAPAAPPSSPADPGKPLLKTFTGLLPKGVKVVAKSAENTSFVYLVLDDGKGRSYVQVNVQFGMQDAVGDLFGSGSQTLPDGTLVATHQGPGEKGGSGVVMWTVDTMRPDGRRVVIGAFNSGAQNTAATRETPALTMKQLRRIALSPQWFQ
ncbi:hypothetical protein ACFV0T_12085 [Streptomyces sp. NPDC059582]|uniref:hypothetical protein n=1 Tax=Streptomyces sp. NPDC059582 TaxID=3346875 RepID=UPI003684F224